VNDVKRAMMDSAVVAMENLDRSDRHISMAIKGLSKKRYDALCARIDALRSEFLEEVGDTDGGANVYAFTIQLFPVMNGNGCASNRGKSL